MVSTEDYFGFSLESTLTKDLMNEIMLAGYSRIPLYAKRDRGDVRGFLHTKKLLMLDLSEPVPVRDLPIYQPVIVGAGCTLGQLLGKFQASGGWGTRGWDGVWRTDTPSLNKLSKLNTLAPLSNYPLCGRLKAG